MDGIIPAAGLATRMRGMPKFLLPCDTNSLTLLERQVAGMLEYCDRVVIPIRSEFTMLVMNLGLSGSQVSLLPIDSRSMTESVLRAADESDSKQFMVTMPDTYFMGQQPYEFLSDLTGCDLRLACWEIRPEQFGKLGQVKISSSGRVVASKDKDPNCAFEHSWGAMAIRRELLEMAQIEMPHTGYLIQPALGSGFDVYAEVMNGEYFDCGTASEYMNLMKTLSNNPQQL